MTGRSMPSKASQVNPARHQPNGASKGRGPLSKEKVSDVETNSESESASTSVSEEDSNAQSVLGSDAVTEPAPVSASENGTGSESETGSSDDRQESGADDSGSSAGTPSPDSRIHPPITHPTRPTPPYNPPAGFSLLTLDSSSSRPPPSFSPSSLAGKQVWHISAPATVPLSSIREVALETFQKGGAVITHDGGDYGFEAAPEGERATTRLLIPDEDGKSFLTSSTTVSQSLRLRQMCREPRATMDIRSTLGATNGITKRRQPDGLKMRFTPLGVRASRETNENLDTFRVPRGVATETASGGLSTKATNGTSGRKHKTPTDVESPRKKSKHKQMIIQDVIRKQPSPAAPEAMVPNGIAEPPRPRSPAPDDTEMGDDEADPRSGRSKERRRKREGRETSVERAIRKERKRKKQREANDAV